MSRNESLRHHRILRNWRQGDVAQQLDIPLSTLQRWERGVHHPSAYYRAKLSALFGLSPRELGLVEEPQPQQEETEGRQQRTDPSQEVALWTVPHTRNPHFTGREDYLEQVMHLFSATEREQPMCQTALPQAHVLKGLGGIGKTQIAVEYAYRAYEQKRYVHTLWIAAASEESILTSLTALAEVVPSLPSRGEADQQKLVAMVIRWLEQCPQSWLLIVDNADDPSLVHLYLPRLGNGCILFTTRASAVSVFASSLDVDNMSITEGTNFLLRRADRRWADLSPAEREKVTHLVVTLAQFPLALDQAAAYIEETRCSFSTYLQLYQESRQRLLARRGTQITHYPDSVATTWSLAFESMKQANPATAKLLQLCAFCSPDAIPEELLTKGAPHWPPLLREAVTDHFSFNQMLETLLSFSLVKRQVEDSRLSLHRLVQVVQMECMTTLEQRQWAERLMRAVNTVFPSGKETETWPRCQHYLAQVEVCSSLIKQWKLACPEAGRLLHQAGVYARIHAQHAQAEQWLAQACAIRQQVRGTEHTEVAESLNELATLYRSQGKYKEAEPLFLRALTIQEHLLGAEHPDIAESLNGLARLYADQREDEEAEPLFLRALTIQEHLLGAEHPDIAESLNGLASLYWSRGRYREAEPLLLRALRIWEHQLGSEHPNVARNLNNLAALYWLWGRYKEAEPLYLRALHIWEHQLGPEYPEVATCLNNLALVYWSWGRYKEAEPLYLRALHIWEHQLRPEHPNVAESLNGLANLYADQRKDEEAEALFLRSLHIREQQLGAECPAVAESLNGLASLYADQGKDEEAEALFLRSLRIREQRLGPEHPDVASCFNGLASLYADQGKDEEAEALFLRSLHIREQQLGAEYPAVAESLNGLAQLYAHQKRYEEAKPLFLRSLHIREQQLGAEHPDTVTTITSLRSL
jgi:Tfp pilus assembly protein PilF/transcriptional regulator with XRE-family HTH domain